MSEPCLEYIHAPDCGWKMTAYGKEVIIWSDGSLTYHPLVEAAKKGER